MNSVHGVLLRHTDDLAGEIGQARRHAERTAGTARAPCPRDFRAADRVE
jgi:hypothetical protein